MSTEMCTLFIQACTITYSYKHTEDLISSCSRSLYALRALRSHDLRAEALHVITGATTIARLLYTSPACWDLTSAKDRDRLEQFLRRIQRMGFLHAETPTIALMPPTVIRKYDLWHRQHNFVLPDKDERNFIARALYTKSCQPITNNNNNILYVTCITLHHFSSPLHRPCKRKCVLSLRCFSTNK